MWNRHTPWHSVRSARPLEIEVKGHAAAQLPPARSSITPRERRSLDRRHATASSPRTSCRQTTEARGSGVRRQRNNRNRKREDGSVSSGAAGRAVNAGCVGTSLRIQQGSGSGVKGRAAWFCRRKHRLHRTNCIGPSQVDAGVVVRLVAGIGRNCNSERGGTLPAAGEVCTSPCQGEGGSLHP